MKIYLKRILALTFFVSLTTNGLSADDGDWQIWFDQSMEGKLSSSLKTKMNQQLKWGDHAGELVEYNVELGLTTKLSSWFDLALFYRQQYEKKGADWLEENRPHLNGTIKWKWNDISFSDRSRVELRIKENKNDIVRYRNKITVTCPKTWTKFNIQKYIADEIFIDSDKGELNRNRLYVGLKAKPHEHLKADVYGLWQTSEKSDEWTDVYVVGAKLGIVF